MRQTHGKRLKKKGPDPKLSQKWSKCLKNLNKGWTKLGQRMTIVGKKGGTKTGTVVG
jgi:hypothetical protein